MGTHSLIASKSRNRAGDALLMFVCLTFFLCGFSSTLNTVIIPSLRTTLHLSYFKATTIDLAFYFAYFTVSPIAGFVLCRVRSFSGIRFGVFCSAIGCFLIASAGQLSSFFLVLLGIYFLGGGIALLQVEGNAYVLVSGRSQTASSRLAFAQFFTSIGQVLAPIAGARILLHNLEQSVNTQKLFIPYLALFFLWGSLLIVTKKLPNQQAEKKSVRKGNFSIYDPVIWMGVFGIMLAVGIEVSIASFLLYLLQSPSVFNISMEQASFLASIFWFLFVVGRLGGSFLLKKIPSFHLLSLLSCLGFFLGLGIIYLDGALVGGMALALGLTTSLLFPIIFSLTIKQSHCSSKQVSGLLCMGNIGGAIFPMIQGFFADHLGVQESFRVPTLMFCLLFVSVQVTTLVRTRKL